MAWARRHHLLRIEQLKEWLEGTARDWEPVEKLHGTNVGAINGRWGIVMCRNFEGEGNQEDDIDLWDGSEMCQGSSNYFEWSTDVWFWEPRG